MNALNNAAKMLGSEGGKKGFGASKRRSVEHYKMMAELSWRNKRLPIEVRFWAKVKKSGPDDCWIWTGCTSPQGYGMFSVNNKARLASRIAWELTNGPIKDGLNALHKCDNPPCCNPNHLFLGTRTDNHIDSVNKGRAVVDKGSKCITAKLNEWDVEQIRIDRMKGCGLRELSEVWEVSQTTISRICHRKIWKHV